LEERGAVASFQAAFGGSFDGQGDPSPLLEWGVGVEDHSVTIEERSRERRKRLVVHRARNHEEAEAWDLEFWQRCSPEERLSALVAIRRDVAMVEAARGKAGDA
jgi:hypothetical protein